VGCIEFDFGYVGNIKHAEYSLYSAHDSTNDNLRVIEGSGDFSDDVSCPMAEPLDTSSLLMGERFITLVRDFEERPSDLSWVVITNEVLGESRSSGPVRSGRAVLAFGPSQQYDHESSGSTYSETIDASAVSPRAALKLIFLDDGSDGFCCENGSASYRVYNGTSADDDLLISSPDERRKEVTRFSVCHYLRCQKSY